MNYIWLVFALTFVGFGIYHAVRAFNSYPKFTNGAEVKTINGLNLGIGTFIDEFNGYLDTLNRDNRVINTWTAVAYFVNATIALFSWYLMSKG